MRYLEALTQLEVPPLELAQGFVEVRDPIHEHRLLAVEVVGEQEGRASPARAAPSPPAPPNASIRKIGSPPSASVKWSASAATSRLGM